MEEIIYKVTKEEEGTRIDKYLALKLGEDYSRVFVRNLIDAGSVLLGDKEVKPKYLVKEGDKVLINMPPPEATDLEGEDIPLNIIHEDEWIVVVDKVPGMVVHPGSGNPKGTLVNALIHHCGKLPETDDFLRPGVVHRLDKDTSGLIVVAKSDKAMRSLAKQFQNRTVKKCYLAIVKGNVEADNGVVDVPIARETVDRRKMGVELSKGKPSKTVYHVVKRFGKHTLLRLDLHTGRTHQIRVHMKHIGHPVVGDSQYGSSREMARQALHAESLGFTHPGTGKYAEFTSPMPDDMKEFIEKISS